MRTGRNDIRVLTQLLAAGRARRVRADAIVLQRRRAHRVEAAHSHHEGVVGRTRKTRCANAFLIAGVAGRGNNHNATTPGLLDGKRERIDIGGLPRVGAIRKVQHANVETVVILVLDDPVDRRNDLGDIGAAVRRRHLQAYDAGVGRDTAVGGGRSIRIGSGQRAVVSGDKAGHERAVSEGVEILKIRGLRFERQVGSVDDLARRVQAGNRGNAAVDNGNVDALTGVPGVPPVGRAKIGSDRSHRVRVSRRVVRGQRSRRNGVEQ